MIQLSDPSERPPEDHWKRRFPEFEAELLSAYYEFKGWNKDGIPTQESLAELGLDYVSKDFIQRGIYADSESALSKETPAKNEQE